MASILLLIITLLIIFILTTLVETVALQLLKWGSFKQSAQASVVMNIASIIIWPLMVFLVQEIGIIALVIAVLLSTLIEAILLTRIKRETIGYNILVALIANLASYLILLLPAFWYSRSG
jgi:hypothetical protein